MGWAVTADPARFDEACDWFLKRAVLTEEGALRLGTEAGQRAFWVGRGLQLDQIQRVFKKIDKAIESGEPFEEWRKKVRGELRDDAHAETVFRNATQRSYNAGRYRQMRDAQQWRPYWMYDSVRDSRTTELCNTLDGTVRPADDPYWDTRVPPLHHRCRAAIRSLRKSEGEKRVTNVPPPVSPAPGFGAAPDADPIWKPDPATHDPALMAELERKSKEGRKPKPKPRKAPKEHDPKHWAKHYEEQYGEAAECVAWGRAMLERGLDRSAVDVLGELQRLRDARHPLLESVSLRALEEIGYEGQGNRQLRSLAFAHTAEWRALIAFQEHTRTIDVGDIVTLRGGRGLPAHDAAQRFYRLSLDKSVPRPEDWQVEVLRGQRAFADPRAGIIQDEGPWHGRHYSARYIPISDDGDSSTLIHELAHAIEFSSDKTLKRSRRFLLARAKGTTKERLADILQDPRYRDDEVAWRDEFVHGYMGKDYGDRATEITARGYEYLLDRRLLRKLSDEDSEMLHFLLGQLAGR